ncbi:MAG: hypothetical protein ACPLKS_07605 [Caldisericum exile]|uniref:hypothetical protein n=1 Tax=Caldisericum exile TaxID=693075 RepID=UPI003C73F5AD
MAEMKWVKITPIDYQPTAKYPRIIVYVDIKFNEDFNQEKMEWIISNTELKEKIQVIFNPEDFVIYQYGTQPLLGFDKKDGRVLTTETAIQHYGLPKIQQQASIVLSFLKRFDLVKYKTRAVSYHKLGNLEEMKERIEAYGRLFKRNVKVIVENEVSKEDLERFKKKLKESAEELARKYGLKKFKVEIG